MNHQVSGFSTFLLFIARVCMSLLFIGASLLKIEDFNATVVMMTSMKVPMSELLLILSIIFELGGGILLLLGWYTRFGAILLIIFVIVVSLLLHDFWNYENSQLMMDNFYHFMKNVFIVGGLLYVLVYGAGRFSLDKGIRKVE